MLPSCCCDSIKVSLGSPTAFYYPFWPTVFRRDCSRWTRFSSVWDWTSNCQFWCLSERCSTRASIATLTLLPKPRSAETTQGSRLSRTVPSHTRHSSSKSLNRIPTQSDSRDRTWPTTRFWAETVPETIAEGCNPRFRRCMERIWWRFDRRLCFCFHRFDRKFPNWFCCCRICAVCSLKQS